jgi:uncharacterized protein YndB with AHSA1/START domain
MPDPMTNSTVKAPTMKTIEVTVTRILPAAPGDVFDTWLDPKRPGSPWFGVAMAIVNPVVDGLFFHLVQFEGKDWAHYGRFILLERPRQIVHTWVSEATHGLESKVMLSLEANDDHTLARLIHRNLPDDEMGRRHEEGWGFVLDALGEALRRRQDKG